MSSSAIRVLALICVAFLLIPIFSIVISVLGAVFGGLFGALTGIVGGLFGLVTGLLSGIFGLLTHNFWLAVIVAVGIFYILRKS